MKVAALALLLFVAWAAPASAQFADGGASSRRGSRARSIEGGATISSECGGSRDRDRAAGTAARICPMTCGYPYMDFDKPQAMVEFFVRMPAGDSIDVPRV